MGLEFRESSHHVCVLNHTVHTCSWMQGLSQLSQQRGTNGGVGKAVRLLLMLFGVSREEGAR